MQPHRFYYYLPGRESRPSPEELVELGLTNRLNGHAHTCLKKGPDGGRGVIVGCDEGPIIFDAESQVWRHYPAAGWWLGNVKDKAPRPEDLERQPMLPGRMCTLGDGRDWLIPVARLLPQKATLDEQGKWTAERDPRFDAFVGSLRAFAYRVLGTSDRVGTGYSTGPCGRKTGRCTGF